ncbi:MAG: zinc-binding dehydrogenase [Anaerolineaceae bacterium]|nr:zinc-binding dehydrogenase [Anaerolineaceae bacterium]
MGQARMQAAVLLGTKHLELRDIPVPDISDDEVLVKVRAATTCGTDVKTYRRGHPKFPPPFVFGHEFGGDITAVGKNVKGFSTGMRVTANVFAECGECFFCNKGQGNLCENLEYNFGAFAEYHRIPARIVIKTLFEIPKNISYAQAGILEPLVTVVHGQELLKIGKGDTLAVIGAGGPVSLLHIQMAKLAGAEQIIAIGHSDQRLAYAKDLGADIIINAKKEDPGEIIQDLTSGYGVDNVIECAGNQKAWESAVSMVRRGGKVLWFGGLPSGTIVGLDAVRVHYGEITLLNTHGGTIKDAKNALNLISSGQINTQKLISLEMPLSQIQEAIEMMIAGKAVKVSILP